jgi:hypothetical protein
LEGDRNFPYVYRPTSRMTISELKLGGTRCCPVPAIETEPTRVR